MVFLTCDFIGENYEKKDENTCDNTCDYNYI